MRRLAATVAIAVIVSATHSDARAAAIADVLASTASWGGPGTQSLTNQSFSLTTFVEGGGSASLGGYRISSNGAALYDAHVTANTGGFASLRAILTGSILFINSTANYLSYINFGFIDAPFNGGMGTSLGARVDDTETEYASFSSTITAFVSGASVVIPIWSTAGCNTYGSPGNSYVVENPPSLGCGYSSPDHGFHYLSGLGPDESFVLSVQFEIYLEVRSVPEPIGLSLLGVGFLGLVASRLRSLLSPPAPITPA